MSEKINVWHILKAHNKAFSRWDNFVFFILPLIVALIMVESPFSFILKGVLIDNLILAMSISIPLLISLLALLYNIGLNIMNNKSETDKQGKIKLVEEVSQSIVFTVFISIITIVLLGVILLVHNLPSHEVNINSIVIFNNISSLISFYFIGIIILSTMMVLKRTYMLADSTFNFKG